MNRPEIQGNASSSVGIYLAYRPLSEESLGLIQPPLKKASASGGIEKMLGRGVLLFSRLEALQIFELMSHSQDDLQARAETYNDIVLETAEAFEKERPSITVPVGQAAIYGGKNAWHRQNIGLPLLGPEAKLVQKERNTLRTKLDRVITPTRRFRDNKRARRLSLCTAYNLESAENVKGLLRKDLQIDEITLAEPRLAVLRYFNRPADRLAYTRSRAPEDVDFMG